MYDPKELEHLRRSFEKWESDRLQKTLASMPERRDKFVTTSSEPVERVYTPLDVADLDYERDLGLPGEYPYTRGVHPTLHRGKLWTMRMFAGFGTAEETNARFKYLLDQGQTGLSIAFDLATLMGYDTDQPEALGEFGTCGVAVSSLKDMEILLDGIPLDRVSTSMTINSPAAIIWAMYIAAAEKQGVRLDQLRGTIQNDILKEFIAQKEFIFPPRPSMRLVVDTMEYGSQKVPQWNTISISGYHIREAGSTAAQELAFTLADGLEYVRWGVERGMDVDSFAPRLSFFFNAHNDFFEEIAKYRAARRIWARQMREGFHARDPRSWLLRFHTQTAGVSLTAQQPENNVVRVALQALAAVLGGTQSLHTNSMDEALALPSEQAVTIALRTQQIIAEEFRRGKHRGSVGRQFLRRGAHRSYGAGGARLLPPDRGARRRDPCDRKGLLPVRDRGCRVSLSARDRPRHSEDRWSQRLSGAQADEDPAAEDGRERLQAAVAAPGGPPKDPRQWACGADARQTACGRGGRREHHALSDGLRTSICDAGRNRGGNEGSLWGL